MGQLTERDRAHITQMVHQLQIRRCHAVDTKDWHAHEGLHATDFASYIADEDRWEIGGKAYTERVAKLSEGRLSAHFVNWPIVMHETAERVRGIWAMQDHLWWTENGDEHWLRGYGFYHETLERRDGCWLFTSRRLERRKVLTSSGTTLGQPGRFAK